LGAQSAQNTSAGIIRIRGLLADESLHVFVGQQQVALDVPNPHWCEHARLAGAKGPFHGLRFFIGLCMRKLQMECVEWVHGLSAESRRQILPTERIDDFEILLLVLCIVISTNEVNKQFYLNTKVCISILLLSCLHRIPGW
jgi:hypothetical protein